MNLPDEPEHFPAWNDLQICTTYRPSGILTQDNPDIICIIVAKLSTMAASNSNH